MYLLININVFAYWFFLFLEKVKTIIIKYFQKNINILLKKEIPEYYITGDVEISSNKEISEEENCDKENSHKENYTEEQN